MIRIADDVQLSNIPITNSTVLDVDQYVGVFPPETSLFRNNVLLASIVSCHDILATPQT